MKAGWDLRPLGELCEILDYLRRPITKKDRQPGEYPYYGATGILDYVEGFLFDERLVLIGEDGAKWQSGERTAFSAEGKYWVNNHAHVVRPTKGRLLEDWLIYYLIHSDLSPFVSGLTVPKLNQGNLREIPIPLPSFGEQERIVAVLDEAFEGIAAANANAEKNLRNARELFEISRNGLFQNDSRDWPSFPLGAVTEVQSGGTPLVSNRIFWNGNIAWYSSGELNDLTTADPERCITKSGLEGSNAKLFPKGSLLIGMYDTAALKMSILDRDAAFNQAVAGVKANSKANLEFVLHAINVIKPSILELRRGVRQKNLSLEKIKGIPIPFPAIAVQNRIVEKVTAMGAQTDALAALYSQKVSALQELKMSLLSRAFNGDL